MTPRILRAVREPYICSGGVVAYVELRNGVAMWQLTSVVSVGSKRVWPHVLIGSVERWGEREREREGANERER